MIRTERLDLVPASLELLRAELASAKHLEAALGAHVPEDWPPGEYDRAALAFFCSRLEAEGPPSADWYVWYAVRRARKGGKGLLIAAAGFLGPPRAGRAEIGYSVIPSARNRGFASEIVQALTEFAFGQGVGRVVAHTSDSNPASAHVLLRCGFLRAGAGPTPGSVLYQKSHPDA